MDASSTSSAQPTKSALACSSMSVTQQVYAAAEDMQNGRIAEDQLLEQLEAAGEQIEDARQRQVVDNILRQKLDPHLLYEAMLALSKGSFTKFIKRKRREAGLSS